MVNMTEAAEAAAGPILAGRNIGVRGERGLASELSNRVGGLLLVRGGPGFAGDVVLYALGVTTGKRPNAGQILNDQLAEAARLGKQGSVVIGIGSVAQLKSLGQFERAQEVCTALLDNHAPASDGLFKRAQGAAVAPTFTVANAMVAWTWCCELFAACTRQGKTPAILPDFDGPKRPRTFERRWEMRFHDQTLEPIAAGHLGAAYLKRLGAILRDVATASWPALARTAQRASDTILDGRTTFLRVGGPYLPFHHANQLAGDPGILTALDHDGSDPSAPSPGPGDFVIAIGRASPPGTEGWGEPEMLRGAGRGVAWIISAYLTQPWDLRRGELLVDQRWPEGDALVKVDGYDTRLAPASSIVAEAILWAITAQVYADSKI